MHTDLAMLCVKPTWSLREAMTQIERNRLGIVLVVDDDGRLLGTVTDGDVRRAVLASLSLQQPVQTLLERKAGSAFARPIVAMVGENRQTYLHALQQHNISHLPIVDSMQRIVGLVTVDDFVTTQAPPVKAVVMAGGTGSRLLPLTEETPKPMLHVGDRPLLELIIERLREAGIRQVKVTTHHKPEKISEHFGDGSEFGVELSYVAEDRPLGTVGGLGLIETPKETTLVMNGDILTQVDFRAMLAYHREHQADLTVAVRHYDLNVPYGVVACDGPVVRGLTEKPVFSFFVNAGIYLLEPPVYGFIPNGQRLDMTELIASLLRAGRPVVSFPVCEHWLDIGQPEDYEKAQLLVRSWGSRE